MDPSVESGPGCQEVNPQFLQQLRELDIPEEAAKQVRSTDKLLNLLIFVSKKKTKPLTPLARL